MSKPSIPKKHRPPGFDILHEDQDVIVGAKQAGFLTVAALWNKTDTIHGALLTYVRKGSVHSKKEVFVVHRLDQGTSGVLVFAKSQSAQQFLKNDWKNTEKFYYAIVQGQLKEKQGLFSSYLSEDEDYYVHSSKDDKQGKLAQTEYQVVHEKNNMSLLKIKLLTGKKNQIRVHLAEAGHPILGDEKYGKKNKNMKNLMLHAFSIEFTHPFKKNRLRIQADVPVYFRNIMDYKY